jgi:hypothetical protein
MSTNTPDLLSFPGWVPVGFAHLTLPNGSHRKRLVSERERFFQTLSNITKSHLKQFCGADLGWNTHEHDILYVWNDEYCRFQQRLTRFLEHQALEEIWGYRFQYDPIDLERLPGGLKYVGDHQVLSPEDTRLVFCPRQYERCRSGKCEHLPL